MGIDIAANLEEARGMTREEFAVKVASNEDWDYKNSDAAKTSGIDPALLDEFGNVHFGMVANANGFNLETSIVGAGAYQIGSQGGGNVLDFAIAAAIWWHTGAGALMPDPVTGVMTQAGFSWGDNPGDDSNIMNGWIYGNSYY